MVIAVGCGAIAVLLMGVAIIVAIGMVPGGSGNNNSNLSAEKIAGLENLPDSLRTVFTDAGNKYQVSPAFVAAIFWVEHGQSWQESGPWATSPSGANGPFQYLECSWEGWNQTGCKDGNPADGTFSLDPAFIKQYGGYGKDGDSDGKTDVQNLRDAAHAASSHLAANGAAPNVTDENKLRDIAATYNSGRGWESNRCQSSKECTKYAPLAIESFKVLLGIFGN